MKFTNNDATTQTAAIEESANDRENNGKGLVSLQRRDLLKLSALSLSVTPLITTASPQGEGFSIDHTATVSPEHAPNIVRISSVELVVEWEDLPSDETILIEFDVRPASGDWYTNKSSTDGPFGSYQFDVPADQNSVTISENDLFDDRRLADATETGVGHPDVSIDDFTLDLAVDPTAVARLFQARVDVHTESQGQIGTSSTDFQIIYIVDTGLGRNLGKNLGAKYPNFVDPDAVKLGSELSYDEFVLAANSYSAGVDRLQNYL